MAINMVKLSEASSDANILRVDWVQNLVKSAIRIQTYGWHV
jgi:hypothetical protein